MEVKSATDYSDRVEQYRKYGMNPASSEKMYQTSLKICQQLNATNYAKVVKCLTGTYYAPVIKVI